MAGRLLGRVALITGAVRRNGRAIALALAREGAAVVINARNSRDEAERVRAEVEAAGGSALVCMAEHPCTRTTSPLHLTLVSS